MADVGGQQRSFKDRRGGVNIDLYFGSIYKVKYWPSRQRA